jgi:protocatechuate 3,4-dioxygenase beta subunit
MKYLICMGLLLTLLSCQSQHEPQTSKLRQVGGPCEGCEALYDFGENSLLAVDTLPDFGSTEPKLMLTGTVYQADGKTPAESVIIYIYHTNRQGLYPKSGGETDWARRHGYIRGWVRTG